MILVEEKARMDLFNAEVDLGKALGIKLNDKVSAVYVYGNQNNILAGVSGLPFYTSIIDVLLLDASMNSLLSNIFDSGESVLFEWNQAENITTVFKGKNGKAERIIFENKHMIIIQEAIIDSLQWGGKLNEKGELETDLVSPQPGPHYFTNLLIGDRTNFSRCLQSTPKSVVDRLGRGSFRSHADTQVLATRWDYRPEENGFPANRQFYLIENGKIFFYSASPKQNSVISAKCVHSQNHTIITYETLCKIKIVRTIFILPHEEGFPIAVEVQNIQIINNGTEDRDIKIVYTGMFGISSTAALREDILFTNVITQSNILRDKNNQIIAVSFDNKPKFAAGESRFHSMIAFCNGKAEYPDQFCFNFNELVGNGTLEKPEGATKLSNRHTRKGPPFFALSSPLKIKAGCIAEISNFTGLVSNVLDIEKEEKAPLNQIGRLIEKYSVTGMVEQALDKVKKSNQEFASHLQIEHKDKAFETYFNYNLPFQVRYQTFVSRSFDQTQKGYREIGFREIQDIFASMYYFVGMGKVDLVKHLLLEWICNVHKMGYANHNFYWTGKEPGVWSDDSLWLLQALDRYAKLTGDYQFFYEECPMADGGSRRIIDTMMAIVTYSGKISIGKNGLPLIDRADWNDCLKVDEDYISGTKKEEKYLLQLNNKGQYGDPFESEYSESVMNGFLLKVAIDVAYEISSQLGETEYANAFQNLSETVKERLQKKTWKDDFFCRVLFNRDNKPWLNYLGAKGDGLNIEEGSKGTYFLNSFSWSVLADVASEKQINIMLNTMDKNLKTPYGYRLSTSADYKKINENIDIEFYFKGDRENSGIFKHANMMAAAAMFKAANIVEDTELAKRLVNTAYWIIDIILPYHTLKAPYMICGNPRLCTQYNNLETGENIGPTISGTSTWMILSIITALGINYKNDNVYLMPLLRENETVQKYEINFCKTKLRIVIQKPEGFYRVKSSQSQLFVDQVLIDRDCFPLFNDQKEHFIQLNLK